MKTLLNELRRSAMLFTLLVVMLPVTVAWGQDSANKLSVTTQMLLNELKGDISFERDVKRAKQLGLKPIEGEWTARMRNDRLYASPDTIDGRVYISTYLRLNNAAQLGELEALGVIVQEQFTSELVTALVPVDQIEAVAGIGNVKRINVSPLMRPTTHAAREKTNVDDVLTQSTDAIAAGLTKQYDGTGVVLGVIDTGIDFQHIAFKDASGNYRMKRAYVYTGSGSGKEYSTFTSLTTDDKEADHGTHTSSTAGGSSVVVSGTNVTVTTDHTKATYGGMAPGANLYLAGINGLSSTYLSNAVKAMATYADAQGMPLVVSNSWGSQYGPHDGTGDEADVYNSLFGDSHPNHIALFASSNDAGKSKDGEGGGYHLRGTASSSSPLRSILRSDSYINTDGGYYYYGVIANAWARSTSVSSMTCKLYVLNASTGAVLKTITVSPSTNGSTVSGLSSYFSGTLYAYKDYVDSDKTQILLYTSGLKSQSVSTTTKDGDTYYKSAYTLAVEFAPSSGSTVIDVWGGSYGYFTSHLTTSGYTWTAGDDDMSVSDEATIANVISIGAYVSATDWTDYNGTARTSTDTYTMGDIAYFSSYATASESPTGLQYPWITAPGARLAAGVNHLHTTSVDDYSYYGSNYNKDLVVNSTSSPYGMMQGTSMATPTAAGIVALWMQAAAETGQSFTVNDIKAIMKETAITDAYTTTGSNASHFGNGKIDALAGIKYILAQCGPTLTATPTDVTFAETYVGNKATQSFTVKGSNLEGAVTLTLDDPVGVFALSTTSISAADAAAGKAVTVTFTPAAKATYSGSVTITSAGAEAITVNLTATGNVIVPEIAASKQAVSFSGYATMTYEQTITVTGKNLEGDISVTLNDPSGIYSVTPATIDKTVATAGVTLTIGYAPTAAGNTTASITLSSAGADAVTIALSGAAQAPTPTIAASPTSLTLTAGIDETVTKTVTVSGRFIGSDVTATLSDGADVFSVSPATIAASSLADGGTATLTIGFNAAAEGTYAGTLTLTAEGAEAVTIALNATANDGGTASDAYLNIAKYATIDAAGWNKNNVANLYKYTENLDDEEGWLTLPAYGAHMAASYQGWITSGVTTTTSASWSATDMFAGSSAYFSGTAYATYYSGSRGSYTTQSETFYVTNCTAVKAHGYNESANGNQSYSVTLNVYECTQGADGTLTAAGTATDSKTYFTKSSTFTLASDALDASKIYKVVLSSQKARLYEVAFCTPVPNTTPRITATPQALSIAAGIDEHKTATFTVSGKNIEGDITLTLADEAGVFTLSRNTIAAAEVADGGEVTVTVDFASAVEGTFAGTITLSSEGAEAVTVTINAGANDGGTAADAYLNIAKYATIDAAGWNTSYVDNLYAFTDYPADNASWLTLPSYGAFTASRAGTQKWIAYNGTYKITNSSGGALSWDEDDIFKGSDAYFTSTSAYGYGRTSTTNTTAQTMTFYVTNCTGVKACGMNTSGVSASYPAYVRVYTCTAAADGMLTASTAVAASATNYTASAAFTLTVDNLDAAQIYKVEVGAARSYFNEVGFRTPLSRYTLAQLVSNAAVSEGKTYYLVDNNLTAVRVSDDFKTLFCKDDNAYASPSAIADGQVDYMADIAKLCGDYDQSNWVALQLDASSSDYFDYRLVGYQLKDVSGVLTSKSNPTIALSALPTFDTDADVSDYPDNLNVFITTSFLGNSATGADGKDYFFVTPKPMEVATVEWAMWDAEADCFVVPPMTATTNQTGLDGGFYADFSLFGGTQPRLEDGGVYRFDALIKVEHATATTRKAATARLAPAAGYVVYPLDGWEQTGSINGTVVTGVNDVTATKQVVRIDYCNLSGQVSHEPFDGVNIVITRYTDGTQKTTKVVF